MEYIIKPKKVKSADLEKLGLSVDTQPQILRKQAASGVIFTLDLESGFDQVILIKAILGAGGALAPGEVKPDEFYVFKPGLEKKHFSILQRKLGEKALKKVYSPTSPNKLKTVPVSRAERSRYCLNDEEIHTLARYALKLEKQYGRHMDLEWAKDAKSGQLYILQARPNKLTYRSKKVAASKMPKLPVSLCLNIGSPETAFSSQFLPNDGVGLARLEFIISKMIGIHPMAALKIAKLPKDIKQQIKELIVPYADPVEFYIERLREGISILAASFYPKEVIFRFSDFKSDEYRNLLGGYLFEENEENPLLGFRGAARYRNKRFIRGFELECQAFRRVRERMGLRNAQIMIPFVRTVAELQEVIQLLAQFGLKRGHHQLKIHMMCELPSNIILAKEFLKLVDGFSIGSNDLTTLVLGLDRSSRLIADLFDERNKAIKILLHSVIKECNKQKKYIGICGPAPSDHLDFAEWLMKEGIQVISLSPDAIVNTWLGLYKRLKRKRHPKSVAQ